MTDDILCIKENKKGRDFIIGDVHGNRNCFRDVLGTLKINDRLFIVGDLTDRGHDSKGVIKLISQNQDRVFSVRGNHEDECLEAINCLETLALRDSYMFESVRFNKFLQGKSSWKLKDLFDDFNASEQNKCKAEYKSIMFDLQNHREWLVELFCSEITENKIKVSRDTIEYTADSSINEIKKLMINLPYIIHIKGSNPFNIVHADMPFDNSVLLNRIKQGNLQLTSKEKKYASWARGDADEPFRQRVNSEEIITYVGHNIIEGNSQPIVRRESNTVNIDVATYDIDASLMVNHTNKSSTFIGQGKPDESLLNKKRQMDKYLNSDKKALGKRNTESTTTNFFEKVKRRKPNEEELLIPVPKAAEANFSQPNLAEHESSNTVNFQTC